MSRVRVWWLTVLSAAFLLAFFASVGAASAAPTASFDGPLWYDTHYYFGTGYYAYSHEVADLNHDGHPDIVVPMYGSGSDGYLRTYLNDGHGNFAESAVTTIPGSDAQLADFDRDGNVDAIVTTVWGNGHAYTIAKGDGAGGFTTAGYVDLPTGDGSSWLPEYCRVADFNGDGIPDLLIGTGEGDNARIYLGNGDCTFTQASVITGLGYNSFGAVTGDINRDGKQDFLVANYGSNTISIRLGSGNGVGFTALPDLPTLGGPAKLILADFDRDGTLDLACSYYNSNKVSVWHGDGTGDFTDRRDLTAAFTVNDIQAADVNLDGTTDLVLGGSQGDGGQSEITVLLNDGNGDFPVTVKPSYGDWWAYGLDAIRVADFNGDGRPDLSVSNLNSNWGSNINLLWNSSAIDHSLSLHVTSASTGATNSAIAAGDFDRDGRLDLAVGPLGVGDTYILKGDGNGHMGPWKTLGFQSSGGLTVGDLNDDGIPDLLSFYSGVAATHLGDGSGGFTTAAMADATGCFTGTALDFDRNGTLDAFAAGDSSASSILFSGTGDGGLTAVNGVGIGTGIQQAVSADFNGDAVPDVAAVASDGKVYVALGDGTNSFSGESTSVAGTPTGIAAGDINGDGKTDLVAASLGYGLQPLLNDGTGAMSLGTPTASSSVYSVVLTDFDLDGVLEAVTAGRDGIVRYFDNNGSGVFTEIATVDPSGTGAALSHLVAADFARNGHPSVAVTCDDGKVYLIGNDVTAPYTTALFSPSAPNGTNGWYVTTPTVTLQTNEPATTRYSLNGSDWADYSAGSGLGPIASGTNTASFWSVDSWSNQEDTVTATFKVDTEPPATSISGLPGAVSSIPVTFTLDATDTASGVSRTYFTLNGGDPLLYTGPVLVSANGTTTVAYWSVDNAGNTESAQSTDVVLDVPEPAVTAPDNYQTDEDTTLTVLAPGVLGNDTDPDGGSMAATLISDVAHGSLAFNADGSFTYAPNAGWNGTDQFTYSAVNAAGASVPETVTIDVAAVNDAPTAIALSNDAIAENEPAGSLVGTFTTTDVDSTSFTYSLVGGDTSAFTISGDQLLTAESFNYEAKSSYSVTVRTDDGAGGTYDQTFTIYVTNVPEPPVTSPDSYQTDEDTTLTVLAPGVLANDTDPLAGVVPSGIHISRLVLGMYASVDTAPSHGTLALASDGSFTYTPDADWSGTDTFTYVATNADGSSAPETVTIDVAPVNDAPTDLSLTGHSVAENEPAGTAVGTFATTDIDSTSFTYSLVGGDTSAFTISGDQLLTAKPFDYETKSSYTITVRTDDGAGGTYDKDFTIDVTDVNEPPVAVADSYQTTEGVALTVPAPGILGNDTDPEGATLTATRVSGPDHGSFEYGSDGSFWYSPDAGFHGTDQFTYTASDGVNDSAVQTVTITVHALDSQPPTTTSDAKASYTGEAGITLTATDDNTGVKATYWKLDGAASVEGTSVQVVTTGTHTLEFWSVDNADNVEATHTALFTVTSDIIPIEGTDRYGTAIRTSEVAFPQGAADAVICRGDLWADVSGGSALAGAIDGPLLLTRSTSVSPALLAELDRLGVKHVYILGSESAISVAVESALKAALGENGVTRIGGADRYATAELVAERTAELLKAQERFDGQVFLATGQDFPDAIAAAPLAARLHRPIVLTRPATLSDEASKAIAAMGATDVRILGSVNAVSAQVASDVAGVTGVGRVERLEGPDRYRTAIAIAEYGVSQGLSWNGVAVGTGTNFPDALAGGVMQGRFNSVVLLTYPGSLHPATAEVLHAHRAEIGYCRILGGPMAVSEDVRVAIHDQLQ